MNWIETSKQMPKAGEPVIAFVEREGNEWRRRIRAMWCPRFTMESSAEDDNCEYHEESDQYYVPEGWYEDNEYEETHWKVDDPVTHWMPLPEPPQQGDAPK